MEKEIRELRCAHCKVYNGVERVFCIRCRRRLGELTLYDIAEDDYTYPPDKEKLEVLREMEPLPYLIERLVSKGREKSMRSFVTKNGLKVEPLSQLDNSVRMCGEILGLEILPEVFITPGEGVSAYTFGTQGNPILVISSGALGVLGKDELTAVIAHELAHVKSKHLLYHILAESLANGAGIVGQFFGAGLVSAPIQMMLLGWYRESEVSADRAALLAVGDMETLDSLMNKLARHGDGPKETGAGTSLFELFQTHPNFERRLRMIREYHASLDFKRGRAKVERRRRISRALIPLCRFCGAVKPASKLFCEACGKSQL